MEITIQAQPLRELSKVFAKYGAQKGIAFEKFSFTPLEIQNNSLVLYMPDFDNIIKIIIKNCNIDKRKGKKTEKIAITRYKFMKILSSLDKKVNHLSILHKEEGKVTIELFDEQGNLVSTVNLKAFEDEDVEEYLHDINIPEQTQEYELVNAEYKILFSSLHTIASAAETARYTFDTIAFDLTQEYPTLVATDGKQLLYISKQREDRKFQTDYLVFAAPIINYFLPAMDNDTERTKLLFFKNEEGKKFIALHNENEEYSVLITSPAAHEENYPPVEKITAEQLTEKGKKTHVVIRDKKEFIDAINRATALLDSEFPRIDINITSEGEMYLTGEDSLHGVENVQFNLVGYEIPTPPSEDVTFSFAPKLITRVISKTPADTELNMFFDTPDDPLYMTEEYMGWQFESITMPLVDRR